MKLYLISQDANSGYDTYDSMVVAAETEGDARKIHPYDDWVRGSNVWAATSEEVTVEYLGEAALGTEVGVICASFNAG